MTSAFKSIGATTLPNYDTHVPAEILKQDIDNFSNFFKFAFVRNPWDRMYSMYKFTLRRNWMPKETTYAEFLSRDDLHVTEACKYQNPIVPITKKPQLDFIADSNGNLLVDYIGKYENIQNDFKYICSRLGVNISLPHINVSPGMVYKDVYNSNTKQFIAKYFEKDIDTFNYLF